MADIKASGELREDELFLQLLLRAERAESIVDIKGTWNGQPFFAIVAVGVSAGLVEKAIRREGLVLIKESEDDLK